MGLFTSIIHPEDGRELQIKSGYDDCETYKLNDTVEWFVNSDYPRSGKLLDDVYDSWSDKGQDDWVVIKNHKVHAVVPYDPERGYDDYHDIREKFQIKDLPDSEWSEEGWKRKRELEARLEKENEDFQKVLDEFPPKQRFALALARPLMRQLNWDSISRTIFKI
jgi:hypothetical protein